jgi:hypothetical protein
MESSGVATGVRASVDPGLLTITGHGVPPKSAQLVGIIREQGLPKPTRVNVEW